MDIVVYTYATVKKSLPINLLAATVLYFERHVTEVSKEGEGVGWEEEEILRARFLPQHVLGSSPHSMGNCSDLRATLPTTKASSFYNL